MNPVTIPQPDPLAVPAPLGLMHALLLLTFFLHLLPMNWILGGSWIALVARAKGRAGSELHADLARRIGKSLPVAVAAAVSFGVAPLLFVQALWGRLFFPSAVLMAWFWFAVVPILIVAYYATYRVAMKGEGSRRAGILAAAGFLAIAFLYVSNMNGMLSPGSFVERFLADGRGLKLHLGDPVVWVRLAHFVLGALAVAGLGVAGLGYLRRGKEPAFAAFAMRSGALWFVVPTALNVLAGFGWLLMLPREVMTRFMGGSGHATALLALGVLLGLASLVILTLAINAVSPAKLVRVGVLHVVATVVVMILMRDAVRAGYLERAGFVPASRIEPQWGVIALFAVLLVAALGAIAWMVAALARAPKRA